MYILRRLTEESDRVGGGGGANVVNLPLRLDQLQRAPPIRCPADVQ